MESSTLLKLHTPDELASVSPSALLATAGRIYPSTNDADVFRIDVAEDDTDVALRTAPSTFDTYGVLLDSSGDRVAADEDGDGGFTLATTLDRGVFYASVTGSAVGPTNTEYSDGSKVNPHPEAARHLRRGSSPTA